MNIKQEPTEWNNKDYIKYKMRVECVLDSEIFFSTINRLINEWLVEYDDLDENQNRYAVHQHSIGREITFTAHKNLTLPMLQWILSKLPDLHIGQQTLRVYEEYTGVRTFCDEIIILEEPSDEVKAKVLQGLERGHEFWTLVSNSLRETAAEFSKL